ncbi:Lachesin [Habropoda laboriosa]|uniref:Lachesin n=1 Tax=Habropoda laboriosa TaxID=597456 RepID=A0A0L7RBN0_9HYME|nr:Lachesin [Habropoda laboriosa]
MFAEPIPNVTVPLGRDVSLPCVVENLGNYKVAWIHVGRQMLLTIHKHVVVKIPRFSVSHDNQKTWLLHISNVQQDDRGYYMCQLNTNPMMSQVGFLQVVVPPNILDSLSTESTVAVRENQNITLTCKADGYPTPKLMWKREDGENISINRHYKVPVYDGEQLNLTRITRNEMGAYLCIATNGVPPTVSKRITVDVECEWISRYVYYHSDLREFVRFPLAYQRPATRTPDSDLTFLISTPSVSSSFRVFLCYPGLFKQTSGLCLSKIRKETRKYERLLLLTKDGEWERDGEYFQPFSLYDAKLKQWIADTGIVRKL